MQSESLDSTSKNILGGYIKLYFSVRQHHVVGFIKPYKYSEAWIWILMTIDAKERVRKMKTGRGYRAINCPAGSLTHSLNFIGDILGWTKDRVRYFLKILSEDNSVEVKIVKGFTQIQVKNWEKYRSEDYNFIPRQSPPIATTQHIENTDSSKSSSHVKPTLYPPNTNYTIHTRVLDNNITRVDNKKKKTLDERKKELDRRARNFYEELDEFKSKYPVEMIQEFWLYWSEPNKSFTKMRYETRQTWQLWRRLVIWKTNEEKWHGKKVTKPTVAEIRKEARDRLKRVFGIDGEK